MLLGSILSIFSPINMSSFPFVSWLSSAPVAFTHEVFVPFTPVAYPTVPFTPTRILPLVSFVPVSYPPVAFLLVAISSVSIPPDKSSYVLSPSILSTYLLLASSQTEVNSPWHHSHCPSHTLSPTILPPETKAKPTSSLPINAKTSCLSRSVSTFSWLNGSAPAWVQLFNQGRSKHLNIVELAYVSLYVCMFIHIFLLGPACTSDAKLSGINLRPHE